MVKIKFSTLVSPHKEIGKTILPFTVSSKGATLTAPAGSSISLSIKVIFCSLLEEAFPS